MASAVHLIAPRRFGWWYFQLKRTQLRSFGDEILIFYDLPGHPKLQKEVPGGGKAWGVLEGCLRGA